MLDQEFLTPADWCRGTDFWMLNDKLDEDELRRQLRDMRAQGVGCVIVRTYIGLRSDYPGKDWMEKMHAVVDEARAVGMKLFMQAGYMPEAVIGLPEKFSLGDIRCYPAGCGEGRVLDTHNGVDYCLVSSRTILDMLSPEACAFYVQQSYENMWRDFKDEFGKTIISLWVDEPSFAKTSLPWTEGLPAAYRELWNEDLPMEKLHLLFIDGEGDRLLRLRYWRTVLHLLKNAYFRSVQQWGKENNILFSGHLMQEDYMDTQIFSTAFTMPLYKYFDIPGIDFLTAEMNWRHGRINPEKRFFYQWSHHGSYVTPLQCTSAAHQAGQNVILAEMYGVSTENLGLRDQKAMFDHFASLGINHRSVHGIFYSLRGRGKRAFPPHVNSYQPYWPKYRMLTDTVARESTFLRAGKPVKDILLLHPIETGFSLFHGQTQDGVRHNETLRRYDTGFCQTVRAMVGMQFNFELGDEDTIALTGRIENGQFHVGEMAYSTVVLPDMHYLRASTLALLQQFIAAGGHVVVLGGAPHTLDTGCSCGADALAGAQFVRSISALKNTLTAAPRRYWFEKRDDDTGVQILCRQDAGDLLFFLANGDYSRGAAGKLTVPGSWEAQLFEPLHGSITAAPAVQENGVTRVPVELTEGGSRMLRLRPGKAAAPVPAAAAVRLAMPDGWRFARENENAMVLEMFRFARDGEELSELTFPVLSIQEQLLQEGYHGDLVLETRFRLEKELSGLQLVTERPELQTLLLDGQPLDNTPNGSYRCFAFETLPLPALAAGEHTLTVRRHFEPMRKPTSSVTSLFEDLGGVMLEAMMLIGDFAVHAAPEPAIEGCIRLNDDMVLGDEDTVCGDELVCRGYPFYAGTMLLETTVTLPEHVKNARFCLEGLHAAAAEVFLNGESCGMLAWAPYSAALKNAKPGKNTLSIRLYGTLRNLLGPWHRPVGEIGACWGGYDVPDQPWLGSLAHENDQRYPDWHLDRTPDRPGWTESYLLVPFGVVKPTLEWDPE